MPSVEEIERILSEYYVISPPKHLMMLERPAVALTDGHLCFFKGLQPKWRNDVMLLTPQGDDETVVHETMHANFGTEELITDRLGKLLVKKYRALERFPRLRDLWLGFRGRNVRYELCSGCELCADLGNLMVRAPRGASPRHYVLKT